MNRRELTMRFDRALSRHGFSRKKMIWNRRSGMLVDVVELEEGKGGGLFGVNVGVLHKEVHVNYMGRPVPAHVSEPECTVRKQLGRAPGGDGEAVPDEEIQNFIDTKVLPFMDEMHLPNGIENGLKASIVKPGRYPPPSICLAIMIYQRGDEATAMQILDEVRHATNAGWRNKIDEVVARLHSGA